MLNNSDYSLTSSKDYAKIEHGLLTPNGELFPCNYCGHARLTENLTSLGFLLKDHKGRHSDYKDALHLTYFNFNQLSDGSKVTQRQYDVIWDYYTAHNSLANCPKLEIE